MELSTIGFTIGQVYWFYDEVRNNINEGVLSKVILTIHGYEAYLEVVAGHAFGARIIATSIEDLRQRAITQCFEDRDREILRKKQEMATCISTYERYMETILEAFKNKTGE